MAFTVENGSGMADATAYISVAAFRAHQADRGRDVSSITDDDAETAIVRATDYIDQRFGRDFRGYRTLTDQALAWPRIDAYDNSGDPINGIPRLLVRACAEYAVRAHLVKELLPDAPTAQPSQDLTDVSSVTTGDAQASGVIREVDQRLGPLVQRISYMSAAEVQQALQDRDAFAAGVVSGVWLPQYPAADLCIAELIDSTRRVIRS